MDPSDQQLVVTVFVFGCRACLVAWAMLVSRISRGDPALKYQPRRPVPWRLFDLVLVLITYIFLQTVVVAAIGAWLGPEITEPPVRYNVEEAGVAHLVTRLISTHGVWVFALCGLSAVVVAPIVEELFFRVVLQGCLEGEQRRWRRRLPTLRRILPGALGPILFTSFLFSMAHFRVAAAPRHPQYEMSVMFGSIVANLATAVLVILLLRFGARATAADFGWVPEKFFGDVGLGLTVFFAVAMPIYAIQLLFGWLLPASVPADPITLFLFAIVLGTLYTYTHRLVPIVVVHLSLNAASLAMMWPLVHRVTGTE